MAYNVHVLTSDFTYITRHQGCRFHSLYRSVVFSEHLGNFRLVLLKGLNGTLGITFLQDINTILFKNK